MAVDKINKINRNFLIKVHIYFNEESYNRHSDLFPRFLIKPVELLNVERVGFTRHSADNQLLKYANDFWKGKRENYLNDIEIEALYQEIQDSYPYGYVIGDPASENKYLFDVKNNESFQSFYKRYWYNNLDKVKRPRVLADGTKDYPFPYIEYTTNEIISYKHVIGTIPALSEGERKDYDYQDSSVIHYSEPADFTCENGVIEVTVNENSTPNRYFAIEGREMIPILLGSTGQRYRLQLNEPWPTGVGGGYSGFKFRFSTGVDGTHNSNTEYTNGVSHIESPESGTFFTKVETKDSNHPYYNYGSSLGYTLSGSGGSAANLNSWDNGAALNLRRESTYYFYQNDSSNSGHSMYISTSAYGSGSGVYTSGTNYSHGIYTTNQQYVPGSTGKYLQFTVPFDAPDTLYYAARTGANMGGQINVISAPAAANSGSVPGESMVFVNNTSGNNISLYYYSPDSGNMGGTAILRSGCGPTASAFN